MYVLMSRFILSKRRSMKRASVKGSFVKREMEAKGKGW